MLGVREISHNLILLAYIVAHKLYECTLCTMTDDIFELNILRWKTLENKTI